MNLSEPFIRRPVMTILLAIALLVAGLDAYRRLPVSNLPDVNYPTITVTANFPGANPEIMANTVATPLEKQFMSIPGIKNVTSSNTLGSSNIVLEFEIDKDIDLAAVDVDAAIVAAKPQLPPNIPQDPTYRKVNPASTPIIYIVVSSPTMTQGEIYDYANTFIGQRLSTIEGVSQVTVYGSPFAVRTQVEPGVMASMGITLQEVAAALNNANQYQPLGQFDGINTALPIYDNGGLFKNYEYDELIVAYKNGSPIKVKDIGHSVDSLQNDRSQRVFATKSLIQQSVTLAVQGQPGANAVRVANTVNAMLPILQAQLPGALQLEVDFDRSESIKESIKDVQFTLFMAFVLVVLVVFIYLGKIKDTIIPAIVMPLAIVATFGAMYLLGYTLDNLSLLALTLSIGFIIDDAIVVLENIVRMVEKGKSPLEASLEGSKQISFTILSMTLSLIAVFIPLLFMAGLIGKLFQEFAVTLSVVTLASGLISLTLTPMLCSRFIPKNKVEGRGRLAQFSENFNGWLLSHYKKSLSWVLDHQSLILLIGILSVIFSAIFFKILPTDFIPDDDIGFIVAFTEAEQGTSSDLMSEYHNKLIAALKNDPTISSITSISANPQYRQGRCFIRLIPRNQRKPIQKLVQEYQKKVQDIPGLNVYFKITPLIELNIGSQVRGSYQYLIQSLDSEALYQSATTLYQKMRIDPIFQGITTDLEIKTPQIKLDIDREYASVLGINVLDFEQQFLRSFSGNRASRIQTPIDQYDVILELDRELQRNPSSLNYLYLKAKDTNALVPLKGIASLRESVGPASINHFAQFPAVTITFNTAPGIPLSTALERLRELAAESFRGNVTGYVKGAAETFEEAIQSVARLLVITIFVIYIVLGILYESFVHPLTILSTLPPAILGALLTLYITGQPLSVYAYLGLILLIGIVKKNGIMMVDFALENIRDKHQGPKESIYEACIVRFRPIMMTTMAAIMGALPIAIGAGAGAESMRPLGYVIIGGMVVSQLITLFLTPVIYLYLERIRERFSFE